MRIPTFVQVEIIPPLHSRDISKPALHFKKGSFLLLPNRHVPHMCDFMALGAGNILLGDNVCRGWVQEERLSSAGNKTLSRDFHQH